MGVSTKMARVFFLSPRFQVRGSSGFTNDTSMPKRPNSCANNRYTPP